MRRNNPRRNRCFQSSVLKSRRPGWDARRAGSRFRCPPVGSRLTVDVLRRRHGVSECPLTDGHDTRRAQRSEDLEFGIVTMIARTTGRSPRESRDTVSPAPWAVKAAPELRLNWVQHPRWATRIAHPFDDVKRWKRDPDTGGAARTRALRRPSSPAAKVSRPVHSAKLAKAFSGIFYAASHLGSENVDLTTR
jgi:hypothetical protein